jgi:hypothetical protein
LQYCPFRTTAGTLSITVSEGRQLGSSAEHYRSSGARTTIARRNRTGWLGGRREHLRLPAFCHASDRPRLRRRNDECRRGASLVCSRPRSRAPIPKPFPVLSNRHRNLPFLCRIFQETWSRIRWPLSCAVGAFRDGRRRAISVAQRVEEGSRPMTGGFVQNITRFM